MFSVIISVIIFDHETTKNKMHKTTEVRLVFHLTLSYIFEFVFILLSPTLRC